MRASGISTGFPVLSRSSGQVPHVLLTRSPLSTRASPGFSFDLHVLGAPPAFVLSQDQTLHRDLNDPPPGLRGRSFDQRVAESPFTDRVSATVARWPPAPPVSAGPLVSPCEIDVNVSGLPLPHSEERGGGRTARPHWLLASLFRFQGAASPTRSRKARCRSAPRRHTPPDVGDRAPQGAAVSGRCWCQCRSPPAALAEPATVLRADPP